MKSTSRSHFLWISATALSAMLYFFAFRFFPQTFPIIHLNITMDLEQALEQADVIAQKNNLGPVDYQNAAMFYTDDAVKTFVELEAGGKNALVTMMEEKLYMPYTWRIRHFKEHEKNESTIMFTPDGKPYGFVETISENIPGEQLSEKDARIIAETEAVTNWNINFDHYRLVEASQKTEMSKRIDHAFVYERSDKKIGEGLYRLKIIISGNKVTELTHFVQVPEAFTRRYTEMRSANITLTIIATLIMILLYVVGGGVGLYWIIKKRWHIIKQPLFCAFVLASMTTLASINQLPFLWMQYNSAFSINGFLAQLLLSCLVALFGQTAFYTIIIMAAEGLTRRAFGNHPQLWSLWSTEYSSSYAVLGRTVGGYLFVGFNLTFVIAFYLLSLRYLGWWSPSEILFDPNILATYVPWFPPIALSLNAGFIEECLFRAIPLAGAALLGTHFGKRNWYIAIAFILQAIIFGAVHANYPVQPSYARLAELLIPSFVWGAIYLRFGLLTTIIAHFVYDVIWFSIPIFILHTPDAFSYKIVICIVTLFPLLRVIYARFRKGTWSQLPESARNASWQPSTAIEQEQEEVGEVHSTIEERTQRKKWIIILGILGFIAWVSTTRFTHDGITIAIDRNQAVAHAHNFLQQKDVILTAPWKTLPLVFNHYALVPQIAKQHIFIWKKGKKDLYHTLLGTYLQPAHWTIRYAQFDTDIVQRAEEHKIMLYDKSVWRHQHQLPESSTGASLTQEQARTLAHATLQEQFNLDPAQLTEISAIQSQLPNRVNWLFVFAHDAIYPLKTGQARISILIAGNEVIDVARTIHVPEEWERKEQNKHNTLSIIATIFALTLIFFLLLGIIFAFRQKRVFSFSRKLFFTLFGVITTISIIEMINTWQNIIGSFDTNSPLHDQLLRVIIFFVIVLLFKSTLYSVFLSYLLSFKMPYKTLHNRLNISMGICIGLLMAGIISFAQILIPINMPLWPSYEALMCSIPLLASLLSSINQYLHLTMSYSSLFIVVDTATAQWQKKRIFFGIFAALLGMTMVSLPSLKLLPLWMITGSLVGLLLLALYTHIIRYNYALIPLATGSFLLLSIIQQGIFNAYPHALLASIINACSVTIIALAWYRYVRKNDQ